MSASSMRHPRHRLLAGFSAWLALMFLGLAQRVAEVRDDGDRGETHIIAVVAMAVAALALALVVGPKIMTWVTDQLGVFG